MSKEEPKPITTQPQPTQTIAIQEYGPYSMRIQCHICKAEIYTTTETESGVLTWILCCVTGICCHCGCCLLPFCMRCSKNIVHRCPNCQQYLGTYKRI